MFTSVGVGALSGDEGEPRERLKKSCVEKFFPEGNLEEIEKSFKSSKVSGVSRAGAQLKLIEPAIKV